MLKVTCTKYTGVISFFCNSTVHKALDHTLHAASEVRHQHIYNSRCQMLGTLDRIHAVMCLNTIRGNLYEGFTSVMSTRECEHPHSHQPAKLSVGDPELGKEMITVDCGR